MFDEIDNGWTCPPLTVAMIALAEQRLGLNIPPSYLKVLNEKNGGILQNRNIRTKQQTFYGTSDLFIFGLLGIGGDFGIDSPAEVATAPPYSHKCLGRAKLRSWNVPYNGLLFSWVGLAGFFFHYDVPYIEKEPPVYYVDVEHKSPRIMEVATNFSEFLTMLHP